MMFNRKQAEQILRKRGRVYEFFKQFKALSPNKSCANLNFKFHQDLKSLQNTVPNNLTIKCKKCTFDF